MGECCARVFLSLISPSIARKEGIIPICYRRGENEGFAERRDLDCVHMMRSAVVSKPLISISLARFDFSYEVPKLCRPSLGSMVLEDSPLGVAQVGY